MKKEVRAQDIQHGKSKQQGGKRPPTPVPTPPPSATPRSLIYPKFAPTSFWYQPLPVDAPLHQNSAAFVQEFARQVTTYYGNVGLNTDQYSSTMFTAAPGDPLATVTPFDCENNGWIDPGLIAQFSNVPWPPGTAPAGGTDMEASIYQPSTDTLWEFWELKAGSPTWQACWGGRMDSVKTNPGIWPTKYGAAATGLPFCGGQILADELMAGEINHVMGIALVDAEHWDQWSWPAQRSDGWNQDPTYPNRIPEGLRLRLDPSVDVDALNLHPVARTIAKAGQSFGWVVWDKAGAISMRCENPVTLAAVGRPNPYPDLFAGTPAYAILNGLPWDKLQFLPVGYGKPG